MEKLLPIWFSDFFCHHCSCRLSSTLCAPALLLGLPRNHTNNQCKALAGQETIVVCWRSTRTSRRTSFPDRQGRGVPFYPLWSLRSLLGHCRVRPHPASRSWWRQGRAWVSGSTSILLLSSLLWRTSYAGRRCTLLPRILRRWCWFLHEWVPRTLIG